MHLKSVESGNIAYREYCCLLMVINFQIIIFHVCNQSGMQSTSLIFTGTCSAWQQPVCKVRPCVRRIVTQQTNRTTRTRPYYSAHCEIKTELWFSNVSQNDRAPVFGTSSTRVVCRAEPDKEQDLREATEEFAELNNAIEVRLHVIFYNCQAERMDVHQQHNIASCRKQQQQLSRTCKERACFLLE